MPLQTAHADEAENARDQAALLKVGATKGQWRFVLDKINGYGDPHRIPAFEAVLGPLFEPGSALLKEITPENQNSLLSFVAAYLAKLDTPKIPLARKIVRRIASDEKLLEKYRTQESFAVNPETLRNEGMDRLLGAAEEILATADANEELDRAVWLLSRETTSRVADSLAVLWNKAREDSYGGVSPAAYLDAFERLTTHRFPEINKAITWLNTWRSDFERRRDWTDLERANLSHRIVRAASELSGAASSDGENAIRWGKELVKAKTEPSKLMSFLDPVKTPYLELRAAAMRHARENLKPEPTKDWVELVRAMLRLPEDEALDSAIAITSKPAFAQRNAELEPLAGDIVTRLKERAETDAKGRRLSLVRTLAVIGTFSNIVAALNDIKEHLEHGHGDEVYAELIQISGQTDGATVGPIVKHYFANGKQPAKDVRDAVVDALGGSAVRADPAQAALASLLLRLIFEGGERPDVLAADVPDPVPAETDDSVRKTILYNLEQYPEPATIELLSRVATGKSAPERKVAVEVLGEIWWDKKKGTAAEALNLILADAKAPDEVRIGILGAFEPPKSETDLKELPRELDGTVRRVKEQVRALIAPGAASAPVQQAAAKTATALRDELALMPTFTQWMKADSDELGAAWEASLRRMITALSPKEDATHDARVADLITTKMIETKRYDVGIDIANKLSAATDRVVFLSAEAALVEARAADTTVGDEGSRRADLERGHELYNQIVTMVENGNKVDVRRKHIALCQQRAALAVDSDEGKKDEAAWLLRAMDIAAESKDKTLAQEALRGPFVGLQELALAPDTDEMKRATVLQTRLNELANG